MHRISIVVAVSGAALLASAATAPAAGVRPTGVFHGTTSQTDDRGAHAKIGFTAAKGRRLKKGKIQWRSTCDNGHSDLYSTSPFSVNVMSRGGAFSVVGGSGGEVEGKQASYDLTLRGRITSAHRAKGTFEGTLTVTDDAGNTAFTCKSGPVTWTAASKS